MSVKVISIDGINYVKESDVKPVIIQDQDHAYKIGANYFVRTVTMAHTGKLVAITKNELVLEYAAWIADTGRFADFLKTGKANEVEPFPDASVIVSRGGVIDAVEITFPLPRIQK